jgi:hypothetical protein
MPLQSCHPPSLIPAPDRYPDRMTAHAYRAADAPPPFLLPARLGTRRRKTIEDSPPRQIQINPENAFCRKTIILRYAFHKTIKPLRVKVVASCFSVGAIQCAAALTL